MGTRVFRGDLPASIANEFSSVDRIAWDTETSGLDWRSDSLGLCQVHAPGVGTALVQITDELPGRLIDLLTSPRVTKVLHHAPFDLRFMRRAWGVRANNIRCTKVASKLVWPEAPSRDHSLGALVSRRRGVVLDKGAVRVSDWRAVDLSEAQISYASRDVEFLLPLLDDLTGLIAERDVRQLYEECCWFLPTQVEVAIAGVDDVFAY